MRSRPFSEELNSITTIKDCNRLFEEISGLLKSLLDVDKRIFKKAEDKNIFKSRLNLYSNLYKKTRVVFIKFILENGTGYYKQPLELEEFLDKYYYSKTIIYDEDLDDEDEVNEYEEGEIVVPILNEKNKQDLSKQTYTTEQNLINEFLKELEKVMTTETKKIFRRDDPEVIQAALYKSVVEFMNKYSEYTTKESLEKAFHEIRLAATKKSAGKEIVTILTGNDKVTEPISTLKIDSNEIEKSTPTSITVDGNSFKLLSKVDQDLVVLDILERTTGAKGKAIKEELVSQGWVDVDYDSVYYSLERVKKQLAKK